MAVNLFEDAIDNEAIENLSKDTLESLLEILKKVK